MRRVRTEFLREGMVIARPVYDAKGKLLLAEGMTISNTFIMHLSEMGIGSLYVDDGVFTSPLEAKEVLTQKTRLESVKLMKETFHSVKHRGWIDTKAIERTVEEMIEEVMDNRNTLVDYYDNGSTTTIPLTILLMYAYSRF